MLYLSSCTQLTVNCVPAITQIASLRKLAVQQLGDRNPFINDQTVSTIVRECRLLHTLALVNCTRLSDAGVAEIARHGRALKRLDLSGCQQRVAVWSAVDELRSRGCIVDTGSLEQQDQALGEVQGNIANIVHQLEQADEEADPFALVGDVIGGLQPLLGALPGGANGTGLGNMLQQGLAAGLQAVMQQDGEGGEGGVDPVEAGLQAGFQGLFTGQQDPGEGPDDESQAQVNCKQQRRWMYSY